MNNKSYSMQSTMSVAKKAATDIEAYLRNHELTAGVLNVEKDPEYQKKDIDLVWMLENGNAITIEIKGDRYYHTGNYFFETISNVQKNTPGCFMYSEADYLYYYFVEARELHVIPLDAAREWFKTNLRDFAGRITGTKCANGGYNTMGHLVPRQRLMAEVPGVVVKSI